MFPQTISFPGSIYNKIHFYVKFLINIEINIVCFGSVSEFLNMLFWPFLITTVLVQFLQGKSMLISITIRMISNIFISIKVSPFGI